LDIPGQAILDGEVVVIHEGRTNFSELQAELAAGKQDRLRLLRLRSSSGETGDLSKTPQVERKANAFGPARVRTTSGFRHLLEHLTGDGQEMFDHARS